MYHVGACSNKRRTQTHWLLSTIYLSQPSTRLPHSLRSKSRPLATTTGCTVCLVAASWLSLIDDNPWSWSNHKLH
ncbi:hypothetical protein M407DRAFT_245962 [Tulasnella calospora MUT 4182]|uniref:Uncharacterized protein n=1 Tax=Tulasnella calospora MUT 4182 TaxID=1051891 RepID=A0A0C3PXZ6_9AGAM|nr:hypothetical protein M407DRAFT_245962 [Tulasnella calospora MUT 4182]